MDQNIYKMKDKLKIKNICFIGAGYVGGPTSAVFADQCPNICVTVVDKSQKKINQWLSDELPIYEPGLKELIKGRLNKNLFFSTEIDKAIVESQLIFICVDTPTKQIGIGRGKAVDLTNLESVARQIAKVAKEPKIVVEKSTVPVKAAESIKRIISSYKMNTSSSSASSSSSSSPTNISSCHHHVVISNPEFLAEGSAIRDLLKPDRVLIGVDETCPLGKYASDSLCALYSNWVPADRLMVMSTWSSELSKLAANAFLAQRVSSINSLTAICEVSGADIREVSEAVGRDTRIGPYFLNASIGFGGSCFKKDVLNLIYLSGSLQLPEVANYWQSVIDLNEYQKRRSANRIFKGLLETIRNKKIAIWGFSFKKDTKDTRDSAAIDVCKYLLEEEAALSIYDPQVSSEQIHLDLNIPDLNPNKVRISNSAVDAANKAHAIVICTEWDEFKNVDFQKIYGNMEPPKYIFDGRLILNHQYLRSLGFEVEAVGIHSDKNNNSNHNFCF